MRYIKTGLIDFDSNKAYPGVTLFSPLFQKTTYLMDLEGNILHHWNLEGIPGAYAKLLPNGNLLVATQTSSGPAGLMARGGKIQELDWEGNVIWEFIDNHQHHDFQRLENGNTIYLGWKLLSPETAERVQGGRPNSEHEEGIFGDYIREVDPNGTTIWEWHFDENVQIEHYPISPLTPRHEWAHPNSIFVQKNGDIMVSWRNCHLIAVIDRDSGRFNFEWMDYDLGHQHDFQQIENGNFMVFINIAPFVGTGMPGSKVLEFNPSTRESVWEYEASPGYTFGSPFISGAQRLKNGNTLICEGLWGRLFEVTRDKEIVWEYISPFFVADEPEQIFAGSNHIFRAYRYAIDGPEIQSRVKL
ncbi:MAG: aryl-sulfate sulfotransferase [Pseudomonadota bacterium]|nr:aryl-sulfate sulfotransferase [Pseudomonadota bacterium]